MKINNETKIGILVVITLVILSVLSWKAGNFQLIVKGYELKVHFKNVDGVELNSPVNLNGFEIGRVQTIKILKDADSNIELSLWIKGDVQINKDVKALIKNMGFMGEKYIGLMTGNGQEGYLPPGSIIVGQEPANFEEMLTQGGEIAKNVKEISQQINERLKVNSQAIDAVVGNMNITMKNFASISTNVNERLEVNKLLLDNIVKNLDTTSVNLEEMSLDLKENPWKLLYKPKRSELLKNSK
jgi:phospholipid/cholesterol/gamma-HCH transport system substrate-binding protein